MAQDKSKDTRRLTLAEGFRNAKRVVEEPASEAIKSAATADNIEVARAVAQNQDIAHAMKAVAASPAIRQAAEDVKQFFEAPVPRLQARAETAEKPPRKSAEPDEGQAPGSQATGGDHPPLTLRNASDQDVRDAIGQVYDDAAAAGGKPPNIRELGPLVQNALDKKGKTASKNRIEELGGKTEFAARRGPVGRRVNSRGKPKRN